MTALTWEECFETGHARIDAQHRVFMDLVHQIADGQRRGDPPERLRRLLDELRLYAEFHFVSEENLMADAGYPGITEHQEEHQRLMNRLRTRINEYLFEVIDLGVLLDFLDHWFRQHTVDTDRALARFLAADG
jgi:hemerythrin